MYSYIPKDVLVKGLSLKELDYKLLDNALKSDEDYVLAALKADERNIANIPSGYILAQKEKVGFSLKKWIKGYLDFPIEVSCFLNAISKEDQLYSDVIETLEDEKILMALLLSDSPEKVIGNFPAQFRLFSDVEYIKHVLAILEKKTKGVECRLSWAVDGILSSIPTPKRNQILEDMQIARYVFLMVDTYNGWGYSRLPKSINQNPEKIVELLKLCYPNGKLSKDEINVLKNIKWHKNLLKDVNFIKEFFILTSKNVSVQDFYWFTNSSIKAENIWILLKELVATGKNVSVEDWHESSYDRIKFYLKNNPELMKFAVNNIPDFIFDIYCDEFYDKENSSLKRSLLDLLDFEDVPQHVLDYWVSYMKKLNVEIKNSLNFEDKDLVADKTVLKAIMANAKQESVLLS